MTDAGKIMHPQYFWTDPTDIRIRICINPAIWIGVPDDFWLKFWCWQRFALCECSYHYYGYSYYYCCYYILLLTEIKTEWNELTVWCNKVTCILQLLVVVSQDYIYFGNNQTPEIYIYDKTNMRHISSYQLRDSGGITDLAMFASDVQPSAPSKSVTQWYCDEGSRGSLLFQ